MNSRSRLGLATLILIPALAIGVFGVRALGTPLGSTPDAPAAFLPEPAAPTGRPVAKLVGDRGQAPVVDLVVWEETDGVTRPR